MTLSLSLSPLPTGCGGGVCTRVVGFLASIYFGGIPGSFSQQMSKLRAVDV
jgi:hypothetical protein